MGKDKTEIYLRALCWLSYIAMISAAAVAIASHFENKQGQGNQMIGMAALLFAGIIAFYAYYISRSLLKRIKDLEQQLENKVESKE